MSNPSGKATGLLLLIINSFSQTKRNATQQLFFISVKLLLSPRAYLTYYHSLTTIAFAKYTIYKYKNNSPKLSQPTNDFQKNIRFVINF